ncbi:tetratricopeptide repeat-containing sensor histidine kinase [Chitinophaga sp.]|uniref:tetratricopeptide repeat-containing sensor histidine kinase n=1 Tax=Chitinophaga sp. TaxID=1869181 RepID=UPI0031DA703D
MFIRSTKELSLLRVFWYVLLVCILSVGIACNPGQQQNVDHPIFFDAVIRHTDSLGADPDRERGIRYLDSVYANFQDAGPGDLYRKYQFKRGYYYDKDYSKSLIYCDSMLYVMRDLRDNKKYTKSYVNALLNKGDVLVAQKRLTEAFEYYYQAKQIGETTHDTAFLADYYNQLGMICYRQEKYTQAAQYFKTATQLRLICGEQNFAAFSFIQENIDNTALSFDRAGNYDSAGVYFEKALSYISANENRFNTGANEKRYIATAKGVIYGNQSFMYLKKGDTASVEPLLLESIRINNQPGYANDDAYFTLLRLANLYINTNRMPEAFNVLKQIKSALDTIAQPDKELRLRWLKAEQTWFEKTKQPDKAYAFLKEYTYIKDSLDGRNRKFHEADISREFDNVARQQEIITLKNDDRLKTVLLVIAGLFLASLITISFLIWKTWLRSKQNLQLVGIQNDRLTTALRNLESRDQENAALLKVIIHDLKNPVGNIGAIAGLLLDGDEFDLAQRKAMYQMIANAGNQAFEIINQLLENKNKGQLAGLKSELTDLRLLLMECIDLLQFKAQQKRQRIRVGRIPAGMAYLDRDKIWQLFTNLIDNAIKFSSERSVISISATRTDNTFTIMIKDKGIGIPPELKEKIFEMHTSAGRPGTAGEQSFGLGLSISRKIAEMHNGHLWFESVPGKETTFYVELPCEPSKQPAVKGARLNV